MDGFSDGCRQNYLVQAITLPEAKLQTGPRLVCLTLPFSLYCGVSHFYRTIYLSAGLSLKNHVLISKNCPASDSSWKLHASMIDL